MRVERKINFFGIIDIPLPIPRSGREDLDGFRYKNRAHRINYYVPTHQVEVTTPGVLVNKFKVEEGAFLADDWDCVREVKVGEIIEGPRKWFGTQIWYSVRPS